MSKAQHLLYKMGETSVPFIGYFYIIGKYVIGEKTLDYHRDAKTVHGTHFDFWAEESKGFFTDSTPELELAVYGAERGRVVYTGTLDSEDRILKSNGFNFFMTKGAKRLIPKIAKMFEIKSPYSYVYVNDEHYVVDPEDKKLVDQATVRNLSGSRFLIGKL